MHPPHRPDPAAPTSDARTFLRALDALEEGLAFFDLAGTLRHANEPLTRALGSGSEGQRLRREMDLFVASLRDLAHLRSLSGDDTIEVLSVRELPGSDRHRRLRGSYLGLDLFGDGPSLLISLEHSFPVPLSEEALHRRFGLTAQEGRIVRLLLEGDSNQEIARRLWISPHTVRHHLERIFLKLGVRSRTQLASRVLGGMGKAARD